MYTNLEFGFDYNVCFYVIPAILNYKPNKIIIIIHNWNHNTKDINAIILKYQFV